MAADVSVDERVAALEVRTAEIINLSDKFDKMMDIVNEIKMSLVTSKYDSMSKAECCAKYAECNARFSGLTAGQTKLAWLGVSFMLAVLLFLIQQLFGIQIEMGVLT